MVVLEAPLEPLDVAFVLLMACQVAFSPWQMLTVGRWSRKGSGWQMKKRGCVS